MGCRTYWRMSINNMLRTIGRSIVEPVPLSNNNFTIINSIKTSGVAYPTTSGWVRDIVLPA